MASLDVCPGAQHLRELPSDRLITRAAYWLGRAISERNHAGPAARITSALEAMADVEREREGRVSVYDEQVPDEDLSPEMASILGAFVDARERRLDAPHVCPGCHAVGEEPCAPGCIDAELAADD